MYSKLARLNSQSILELGGAMQLALPQRNWQKKVYISIGVVLFVGVGVCSP
jgi:hypothetical protein